MLLHVFRCMSCRYISLFFFIIAISTLISCASSNVSRTAADNVDLGVQNAKSLWNGTSNGNFAEAYQNTNQTTKGALIGGVAGGIGGFLTSGIGVLAGTATGAVLGASYGAYIDSNTNFEDRLENRGANIIVLGDQILVVFPSTRIFLPYTATIKQQSYSTLYMLARFINRYTKTLVRITVYTSDTGSPSADLALSNQQAYAVSRFLQASGIDARLIYASGCGGTRLVDNVKNDWDASDNYRIEISFEKLYV